MTSNAPDTSARIRELIAQGMTHRAALDKAMQETIAWARANGYASDKPSRKK